MACIYCYEEGAPPLGCGCRGSAGHACVECVAAWAREKGGSAWHSCLVCKQAYNGATAHALSFLWMKHVSDSPHESDAWLIAAENYATSLIGDTGDAPAARALYKEILAIYRKRYGDDHERTTDIQCNLILISDIMGDYAAAEVQYWEIYGRFRRLLGPTHEKTMDILSFLAMCHLDMHNYDTSEALCRHLMDLSSFIPPDGMRRIKYERDLAFACLKVQKRDEAKAIFTRILPILIRVLGPTNYQTVDVLTALDALQ